jgi:hypothetical protein
VMSPPPTRPPDTYPADLPAGHPSGKFAGHNAAAARLSLPMAPFNPPIPGVPRGNPDTRRVRRIWSVTSERTVNTKRSA